ncbi:MAG: thiosulfate oxidation carrier protein SoxY [Burkholderiales bacterium]
MNSKRRKVLQFTALVSFMAESALRGEADAPGWNKAGFADTTMDEVKKAQGGGAAQKSDAVMLKAPDIAENGAVVPVGITTTLKATSMAILVEKNPNMLAGYFDLPAGTEPFVTTRVKMGQTSNVYALVKADGKWFSAFKEIKVTLGGCGG